MNQFQPKPNDISLASIHKLGDRTLICIEMWWSNWNLVKVAFYEPKVDKINEIDYKELIEMIKDGGLVLYAPIRGRTLSKIQEEHFDEDLISEEEDSIEIDTPVPIKPETTVKQLGLF